MLEVSEGGEEREMGRKREKEGERTGSNPQLYGVRTPRLSAHPLLFDMDRTLKRHAILG